MGMYLNPGNNGFKRILKDYYVDKTGMIELINNRIDSMANLICISRPRRFGKSYAARMLCAYYDCTCKSDDLFKNFEISVSDDYNEHLNQYNVIYLDLAGIISKMNTNGIPLSNVASRIKTLLNQEIRLSYPTLPQYDDASDAILAIVNETKQKFVFIIDEWDAVIREAKNDTETQEFFGDSLDITNGVISGITLINAQSDYTLLHNAQARNGASIDHYFISVGGIVTESQYDVINAVAPTTVEGSTVEIIYGAVDTRGYEVTVSYTVPVWKYTPMYSPSGAAHTHRILPVGS